MGEAKLLVVIGATGTQGGSVVNSFLRDPEWRLRGITRDADSSKARELSARGVEMVAADLNDADSLRRAFQGAAVVFGVTDFWKPLADPELTRTAEPGRLARWAYEYELQQGRNIFDAAASIGTLDRLIFSTIQDVAEASNGKYVGAYHADTKAHAEMYGKNTYPDLYGKTSTIQVGVYLSNFKELPSEMPKKEADGSFNFVTQFHAETPLPLIATDEDTGPLVAALLKEPPGTKLMGYREWMTVGKFVDTWGRVLNVEAKITTLPINDILDAMPGDMAPDVREMLAKGMANLTEFGYKLHEELTQPSELKFPPRLGTVEGWIKGQDWSPVL
ncbi:putative hscarg dehydrogenase, partial [Lineolata rhizophorae]